jgi:hypothetical protein
MDAELFRDFFDFKTKANLKETSTILTVEGRMYENKV